MAVERGRWTERDAPDADLEPGVYITVWTKISGQWKVLYDAGTLLVGD